MLLENGISHGGSGRVELSVRDESLEVWQTGLPIVRSHHLQTCLEDRDLVDVVNGQMGRVRPLKTGLKNVLMVRAAAPSKMLELRCMKESENLTSRNFRFTSSCTR